MKVTDRGKEVIDELEELITIYKGSLEASINDFESLVDISSEKMKNVRELVEPDKMNRNTLALVYVKMEFMKTLGSGTNKLLNLFKLLNEVAEEAIEKIVKFKKGEL